MGKIALIIIYNHQYNENIDILEALYAERFSHIYHLVPFYEGDKPNVIPVYENSFYFQGYIAQGFKSYFRIDFDHYFFIADDLILNPCINEDNYTAHLKLRNNTSFLPGFINLHETDKLWPRVAEAYFYNIGTAGVEAKNQLPDYQQAMEIFKRFLFEFKPLKFEQIWRTPSSIRELGNFSVREILRWLKSKFYQTTYDLPYPLVGAYADICVVSSVSIKKFCHYCGVTAATNLFVEVALPTSLVLSAEEIVTEEKLDLKGRALWTNEDYQVLNCYENKFDKLVNDFPLNYLYLHPVKLSKWINKPQKNTSL